jgi:hypothetical protein
MRRRHAPLLPLLVAGLPLLAIGLAAAAPGNQGPASPATPLDFDQDIRPLLAENCFACHGFDAGKRQAGLRLDTPEGAYAALASGRHALVPGDTSHSELVERITLPADGPLHMPPAGSGKALSAAQVTTLRRWVAAGARYEKHWAFVPPKRPPLPAVRDAAWPRNPIDRFVLARLETEGLTPSPEADKRTLIRRVTLDLTGLPPMPGEVDAFLADRSPNAYEKVVDRLIASPRYGERMALPWLDLARYADTHGFHIDSLREMWRWRDWVIGSFNRNLPYDRFVLYQLAGDLLPNATLEQKIATGFNRNHPINYEGGAIPEEYGAVYVHDRVDTTATAFLGLTIRCAQSHDHKYDPIAQKDYYRFFALFNNITEKGLDGQSGNAEPFVKSPTPEQATRMAVIEGQVAGLKGRIRSRAEALALAQAEWEKGGPSALDALPAAAGLAARYRLDEASGDRAASALPDRAPGVVKGKADWQPGKFSANVLQLDGSTYVDIGKVLDVERSDRFSYGAWVKPATNDAATVVSRMDEAHGFRGWDMYLSGGRVFVHLIHEWDKNAIRVNTKSEIPQSEWTHLLATYDGSGKAKGVTIYINGRPADLEMTHDALTDTLRTDVPTSIGRRTPGAVFKGQIADVRLYARTLTASEAAQVASLEPARQALATQADKRTPEQKDALASLYLTTHDPAYRTLADALADAQRRRSDLDRTIPTTMVMQEREKPQETHLLLRGQYDKPGEVVTPGIPELFGRPFPLDPRRPNAPANRLELAYWLTDPDNPLTARVAVNRFWQMYFGQGLVRTPENFGTQGERPTHPELLDYLATEFTRTAWNVKAMQRLIVTSATYRQSSRVTPRLRARDPENRLLARAPRLRLHAEFVRDQALAVSGLLTPQIGGPSVRPYQPPGLWEELSINPDGFSAQRYVQDHGPALYRRTLYTFWKRTVPPPSLQTLDAPEREFCVVRRPATNTPLQALVLMNDPTYVEASRKFAERILREGGTTAETRLSWAYEAALARAPRPAETVVMEDLLLSQLVTYGRDREAAKKLLTVGEAKADGTRDPAEVAAWTTAASVLLNLDETLTKE